MGLIQYVNCRPHCPESLTALDFNSKDFLSFFPFLFFIFFSSSHSKHCRVGLFFNKISFRYQVCLQLQQEQYPSVLSFPFAFNNLRWVQMGFALERKKIIMNDLK